MAHGWRDAVLASPRASFAPGVASSPVRRRPRRQGRHRKRRRDGDVSDRKALLETAVGDVVTFIFFFFFFFFRRARRRGPRVRRQGRVLQPRVRAVENREGSRMPTKVIGRARRRVPLVQRRRAVRTVGRAPGRHGRRVLEQRLRQRALLPPRVREAGRAAAAVAAPADDAGPVTAAGVSALDPSASTRCASRGCREGDERRDRRLGGGDSRRVDVRRGRRRGEPSRVFERRKPRAIRRQVGAGVLGARRGIDPGTWSNGNGQSNAPKASTERFRADVRTTARISPYVRHGELSPREVYHSAKAIQVGSRKSRARSAAVFLRRLAWRDLAYWSLWRFRAHVRRAASAAVRDAVVGAAVGSCRSRRLRPESRGGE